MRVLLISLSLVLLLSSCCIEGKMGTAQQTLSEFRTLQEKENQKVSGLKSISDIKLSEGRIDTTIQNRIIRRLEKFQWKMQIPQGYASVVDSLLQNRKAFRKNYKTLVLPLLDSLVFSNAAYANRLKLYLMIEDGLSIANYQLFDLAAFFGPGKYEIPVEKSEIAVMSFSPIIDSVVRFAGKYDLPSTASLVILGFADGTGFSNSGPLFETLTGYIGRKDVTKEELNQKLSELRARELITQLTRAFMRKAPFFKGMDKVFVEYIGQGKGEAFPLPTIKDYTVDDTRRRIVLCYWAVLPE